MEIETKNIAIFASGRGSNAKAIIEYFRNDERVKIVLIVANDPLAGVLELSKENDIHSLIIDREMFYRTDKLDKELKKHNCDLIVLAGFLWLVPSRLLRKYPGQIINIHPALLPKYGGKGMYGMHVHKAVKDGGDDQSGITIHFVNENYDEGNQLFQASCMLDPKDKPEEIAAKVLKLEHYHFPRQIEKFLFGTIRL